MGFGLVIPWVLRKVEVSVRLIIVVKNKNCQVNLIGISTLPKTHGDTKIPRPSNAIQD